MTEPIYTQDMRANRELCPLCGMWHTSMSCAPQFAMQSQRISELLMENKKLKDALEFYADGKHYEDDWFGGYTSIESDKGKIAREALK